MFAIISLFSAFHFWVVALLDLYKRGKIFWNAVKHFFNFWVLRLGVSGKISIYFKKIGQECCVILSSDAQFTWVIISITNDPVLVFHYEPMFS